MDQSFPTPSTAFQRIRQVPLQVVVFVQTILIVGMIISIPLIYITLRNTQGFSQAATAEGVAEISFSPAAPSTLTPGIPHTVDLLVDTKAFKVDGVQTIIVFTGSVPEDLTFSGTPPQGLSMVAQNIEPFNGAKRASIAFITSNPTQPYTTNSTSVKLGTFTFTAPLTGQMTMALNQQLSTVIDNQTSKDILKTIPDSTYTFAFAQNQSEPTLYFGDTDPTQPLNIGDTLTTTVMVDTGSQSVSGVDAHISFDPGVLEVQSVEPDNASPFNSYPEMTIDNAAGKLYLSGNIGTGNTTTGITGSEVRFVQIQAIAKISTSSSALDFDFTEGSRNDSNIVLFLEETGQEPADILAQTESLSFSVSAAPTATPVPDPTATAVPTATPTTPPSPTPTPKVPKKFKVRFGLQGKNRAGINKARTVVVNLKAVQGNASAPQTIVLDAEGVGEVSAIPDEYILLAETAGYLGQQYGSTDTPVSLQNDQTITDLSAQSLLGGEFNQDGEVNEIDYTLHFLTKFRASDPIVDLDSSGTVNNLDFAIMRGNWGRTSDTLN